MDDLPDNARRALLRAHAAKGSYAARLLRAPDGRTVAILGEAHLKLAKASREGSRSGVGCANDRPCESTRYLLYKIALALEPPTVVTKS